MIKLLGLALLAVALSRNAWCLYAQLHTTTSG